MLRHVLERRAGSCCVLISRTFSAAAASPDRLGFGFCKVTIHTWQSSEQNLICMLTAFLKESRCISPCKKKKIHAMYGFFSVFPSIRVFSNESGLCIRWPKYWSFSFSISPSNEYSEFIFFRMDWHAAVHGVTKCQTQLNDWTTITAMNLCWRWG